MAKDYPSGGCAYTTIIIILIVIVAVSRLCEVASQHIVCLLVDLLGRSVNQQVRCLVTVGDTVQTALVEQRLIEEINSGGGGTGHTTERPLGVVMTSKVNGRHVRIGSLQVFVVRSLGLRVSHEVDNGVEVSHIHHLRLIVRRCTIYAVALIGIRQTTTVLHDA